MALPPQKSQFMTNQCKSIYLLGNSFSVNESRAYLLLIMENFKTDLISSDFGSDQEILFI